MTSKQVTSPPWNSRRLVHSKEMAWASRWSVALRAFYKQILSSSNCKDFFFKWHRPPRKLAKEVFVKFIPAKEKTRFAKEWRKVLAKDHVIRIDSHEVFNTAQLYCLSIVILEYLEYLTKKLVMVNKHDDCWPLGMYDQTLSSQESMTKDPWSIQFLLLVIGGRDYITP